MNSLKNLCAAVALTFVLGMAAFAGEVSSPPCPPPDPGEVQAPPCSAAQTTSDDPVASAEPSESSTSSVTEISVTTLDVLLSALTIF